MRVKDKLKNLRDQYVINQVKALQLPMFEPGEANRYRIVFEGRVQRVGFRLEVCELAKRLGLTGFCRNLENGAVLAELQGSTQKIAYLLSYMESLKRIKIVSKTVEKLEVDPSETEFLKQ